MNRRSFFHASLLASGLIAVPQFGRWFPERRRGQVIGTLFYETPYVPISPQTAGVIARHLDTTYMVVGCDMLGREVSFEFQAKPVTGNLLTIPADAMEKLATMPRCYLDVVDRMVRGAPPYGQATV